MSSTYLGDVQALLAEPNKRTLREKINHATRADIDSIAADMKLLSAKDIGTLNLQAATFHCAIFMLATVKSPSDEHDFDYQSTLDLLGMLSVLEEHKDVTPEEVDECGAWLIRGYRAKQGLNLLINMKPLMKTGSQFFRSPKIDAALVAHLEKTKNRPLEYNELLKISDGLSKTHLALTITALMTRFKETGELDKIKQLYKDSYENNHLGAVLIRAMQDALGSEMFLSMAQDQMIQANGDMSLLRLQDTLTEKVLYSDNFGEKIVSGITAIKPVIPNFIKTLCVSNLELELWPETGKIMVEHYDELFCRLDFKPHRELTQFAIKNGLQHRLIEKMIDAMRVGMISLGKQNFDEVRAMPYADVLSWVSTNHKGDVTRETHFKNLIGACKGIDLVEMKDVFGTVDPAVIALISDVSGGLSNKRQVMLHYPQAKGILLERDLGL